MVSHFSRKVEILKMRMLKVLVKGNFLYPYCWWFRNPAAAKPVDIRDTVYENKLQQPCWWYFRLLVGWPSLNDFGRLLVWANQNYSWWLQPLGIMHWPSSMLSKIGLFKFNKNLTWNIMKPPSPNLRTSTTSFKFQANLGLGWNKFWRLPSRELISPIPAGTFESMIFSKLPVLVGYVSAPWRVCVFHRISWCRRRSASSDSEASSRFEVSSRWLGRLQRWLKHRKFKVPPYTKLAKGWAFVDEPAVVALGWFVDFLLCFGWTF